MPLLYIENDTPHRKSRLFPDVMFRSSEGLDYFLIAVSVVCVGVIMLFSVDPLRPSYLKCALRLARFCSELSYSRTLSNASSTIMPESLMFIISANDFIYFGETAETEFTNHLSHITHS